MNSSLIEVTVSIIFIDFLLQSHYVFIENFLKYAKIQYKLKKMRVISD